MRLTGRVDGNQREIVEALRKAGCSVAILSDVGKGIPDLSVGYLGRTIWMEVKSPGGKLTPAEEKFRDNWHGSYAIVHNIDEALEAMGILEERRLP